MGKPVIILDELDFLFRESELKKITTMHNNGSSITEIKTEIKRDEYELFLALIHLHIERKLTKSIRRA